MFFESLDKFLHGRELTERDLEMQRLLALSKQFRYGGRGRNWHPEFVKYMYEIATHPNYEGIPWGIDNKGKVRWNAPSHRPPGGMWSNLHDERLDWWKKKASESNILLRGHWISKIAKKIHPFKRKPCQTCGRNMSLLYEYPTRRIVDRINEIPCLVTAFDYSDFQSILEVIPEIVDQCGEGILPKLSEILSVPKQVIKDPDSFVTYVKDVLIPSEPKGVLSPGAMSNAPDRLDGFHSYNLCCRPKQDTGRTPENLRTYGIDRRTFQYWCDGDWAAADYLMNQKVVGRCKECGREGELTAQHIGPLSLGFCHRPKFEALCRSCNSAKNNKMSFDDVRILRDDERKGEVVVSWYAKPVWDRLKNRVKKDSEALQLSKIMRANQHQALMLLSKLNEQGHRNFLAQFLHPEYAMNRYKAIGFGGKDFRYKRLIAKKRQLTYAESMIERTERIGFEALEAYGKKSNRNAILLKDRDLVAFENLIVSAAKAASEKGEYKALRKLLMDYMDLVAVKLVERGVPRGYWK